MLNKFVEDRTPVKIYVELEFFKKEDAPALWNRDVSNAAYLALQSIEFWCHWANLIRRNDVFFSVFSRPAPGQKQPQP